MLLRLPRPSSNPAFFSSLLGSSGGGEEQEPGEDVGGAGLGGDDGVVQHRHQGNRVSGLQLQDRRAGSNQEAFRRVARGHGVLLALHQLQTHLRQIKEQSLSHIAALNERKVEFKRISSGGCNINLVAC